MEHLRAIVRRLGVLQLDFVNVLVPAHYLVMFSRLGPYARALLDEALYSDKAGFTEAWAHEASLIPVQSWPLFAHRRAAHRDRPWAGETFLAKHAGFADWVLHEITHRGPHAAEDFDPPEGIPRTVEGSWYSSSARVALEAHFGRGVLAVRQRRPNFARVFDLSERLIPPELHSRNVDEPSARRLLLLQAARALGIASAADLADYFRMPVGQIRGLIQDLCSAGELQPVRVEGWPSEAYLHPAIQPGAQEANSLLSPFDPLVWYRPRTARLFGFDYKLEIFMPVEQRRWGYYVLPFLYQGRLAARVDLKADRPSRRLLVLASFLEPGQNPAPVAQALSAELNRLALWLGLQAVTVGRKGNLSKDLRAALKPFS